MDIRTELAVRRARKVLASMVDGGAKPSLLLLADVVRGLDAVLPTPTPAPVVPGVTGATEDTL